MLILFIVAMVINYLILPLTKDISQNAFGTWNRAIGIIYLIPGISLVIAIVALVTLGFVVLVGCVNVAIEEDFIDNYFKYEGDD